MWSPGGGGGEGLVLKGLYNILAVVTLSKLTGKETHDWDFRNSRDLYVLLTWHTNTTNFGERQNFKTPPQNFCSLPGFAKI